MKKLVLGAALAVGLVVGVVGAQPAQAQPAQDSVNACGKCGDGYCNPRCGETSLSCPRDCGISSES